MKECKDREFCYLGLMAVEIYCKRDKKVVSVKICERCKNGKSKKNKNRNT